MKLIDLCERIQRMKKWYIPLIALTVMLFLIIVRVLFHLPIVAVPVRPPVPGLPGGTP